MRPITIVGGGLAGLVLGVLLRRGGVPVQLWEAAAYPRHKVCGEFISGRGAEQLLELVPAIDRRTRVLKTVCFYHAGRQTSPIRLPSRGLSISRWELDAILAEEFTRVGGEIAYARWSKPFTGPGLVRATGRRRNAGSSWTGLKAHVQGVNLSADLEMHFSDRGYVGISRLPNGCNVSALVNENAEISDFKRQPSIVFSRLTSVERFNNATFVPDSVCAVSGISFDATSARDECCIGDATRMIPPFTGNGMSLAIESAFAAAPTLIGYSSNRIEWPDALRLILADQRKQFRSRFTAAEGLRRLTNRSWTRKLMLSTLKTVPRVLSTCFRATRM